MDMLRNIRSRISAAAHHDARDREKKEEFFKFSKTIQHGFPSKPSCFAYDSALNILAIGTKTGFVKVYGAPGVEFVGHQSNGTAVNRLLFLPNQGRLVSLCDDQSFHLWEIDVVSECGGLTHVKECTAAGKLKKISCWCLRDDGDLCSILIGTESGNVYSLDTTSLELTDYIIYQDAVIQNIPDDYKVNPGAVEALAVHPTDHSKVLIGYNRGLIVLWDSLVNSARRTFVENYQVESLCWHHDGERFISSHNDGSYIVRPTFTAGESDSSRMENKPFGPFPLKPIEKIVEKHLPNGEDLIIFMGGMPRSYDYAEKFVVTVEEKMTPTSQSKQVTFDFNSKVVDFLIVDSNEPESFGQPSALMVLCEEELVAIDLATDDWKTWRSPYCYSIHSSAIMSCVHASYVNADAAAKIKSYGESVLNDSNKYSNRPWPIQGGVLKGDPPTAVEYLITGHEDGTVKFWASQTSSMNLVCVVNVGKLFDGYVDPNEAPTDGEVWPPFRKVGIYDSFTDDPRYGVQRLVFDSQTGTLVVGCSAGQITVWELTGEQKTVELDPVTVDIVEGFDNFVWKGQAKLDFSKNQMNFAPGYAPKACIELNPPAAVTCLAVKCDWNVVAAGTAQGFTLFDFATKKCLTKKCLLTVSEVSTGVASSEGTVSRFKSFKKSLRESFRRRRRQRSPKSMSPEPPKQAGIEETSPDVETSKETKEHESPAAEPTKESSSKSEPETKKEKQSPVREKPSTPVKDEERLSPIRTVERAVEARSDTDQLNSMVRSLYFCQTYPVNASTLSPTFLVGTNGGVIYIHILTTTTNKEDESAAVVAETTCQLAKEIRLKHRAPVLGLTVVDGRGFALDNHPPISASTMPITEHGHRLIVVSEEQLKAFHLPKMSPERIKYKVTANEGSRIRKVQFVNLQSKIDENKWEPFILIMTNQGDLEVFGTAHFRRYMNQNCVPSQTVGGILSTVLTRQGEGFYLLSSSEWQRFTISAKHGVRPRCSLLLPEGARPPIATNETATQEEDQIESKKDEPPPAADKPADVSALSEESHNVSATLPNDMTMDSIRDYTTETHIIESNVTSSGVTTITTKTSKITVTADNKKINDISEELVNGDHQGEVVVTTTATKKIITQDVVSGPAAVVAE